MSGSVWTSSSTPPRTASRPGPARGRARRPTGSTPSSCGPPTPIGWRHPARWTAHPAPTASAERGPAGAESGRPARSADVGRELPPLRGKRGRERRVGEQAVALALARQAAVEDAAVDFDVAEAEAEVADARRAAAPPPAAP